MSEPLGGHHRQCGATGGSGAGSSSSTLVTDPLLWAAATTALFAGRSADLTPTVIKCLGAVSRVSKLFGIEVFIYIQVGETIFKSLG